MSTSITVFDPGCELWRIFLAYIGYFTPSVLLLTLLAFYDPKSTLCYEFQSTFLLNNTQPPSSKHLPANETIIEEFENFHTKFFSNEDPDDYYFYFDETYNYNYYLYDSKVEDRLSWEAHLENLSIANKHFLLKTFGTQGPLNSESDYSRDYYHQMLASFNSSNFIENSLSLLRQFGFHHFCSEKVLFEAYTVDDRTRSDDNSLDVLIFDSRDFWWRGYSPYDTDYSDNYETLLDAMLLFEDDQRFSDHLVCWSKIFDIEPNVLHRDFQQMKDLKAQTKSMVIRKGDVKDDTLSVEFYGERAIVKKYNEYWPSFYDLASGEPVKCFWRTYNSGDSFWLYFGFLLPEYNLDMSHTRT